MKRLQHAHHVFIPVLQSSELYTYVFGEDVIQIIIDCLKLKTIGPGVFGLFQKLDTLQITRTGLSSVPDFSAFETKSKAQNNAMYEIDLSANKIQRIKTSQFSRVKTYELRVQNNLLTSIEDGAFAGALIKRLFCRNNFNLRHLGNLAFSGIQELHFLDLSRSKITVLPTEGLINIRELVLEETPTLKKFPSVFKFSEINTAKLTYEHHCCAFRHADKQDPVESSLMELTGHTSACAAQMTPPPVFSFSELQPVATSTFDFRVRRSTNRVHSILRTLVSSLGLSLGSGFFSNDGGVKERSSESEMVEYKDTDAGFGFKKDIVDYVQPTAGSINGFGDHIFGPIIPPSTKSSLGRETYPGTRGKNIRGNKATHESGKHNERQQLPGNNWHDTPHATNGTTKWVTCGNFSSPKDYSDVICTPRPNAFNPCEDVMGYEWLRVFVWLVLLAAIGGNVVVMVVLLTARSKLTVPKFLMCNLSFADFLMGLYLLLIASVDVHFLGEYFTHAVSWQNDGGCQVAGFLTVFSSELSVFVLTVITLERWYAISQAIHVNKRLRMRQATCLIFAGWMYASGLAILPLLGVSGYGAVSMCLPMEANDPLDILYISSLLIFNGIAFTAICWCYISMFLKVRASENMARSNDATIAKRMAILVLTNFICWAPIAFFGLTASFGFPLIDITNSKVLLVFFYPFNSCANPFLYAILTKQFRKDVFILLGRHGLCTDRANRYKGTSVTRSYSYNSRHNNGLMVNANHHRHQPTATDVSILSQYCRAGSRGSRGSLLSQNGGGGWSNSTPTRNLRSASGSGSYASGRGNTSKLGMYQLSNSGAPSFTESTFESYSSAAQSLSSTRAVTVASPKHEKSAPSSGNCLPSDRVPSPTNNSGNSDSGGSEYNSDQYNCKNERKLSTVLETSHASSDAVSEDGLGVCVEIAIDGDGVAKYDHGDNSCDRDQASNTFLLQDPKPTPANERVLGGRDSLRDLFEGQPHGRVRSASEYVVIFKNAEGEPSPSASIVLPSQELDKTSNPSSSQHDHLQQQLQRQRGSTEAFERRISRDTVLSTNTVSSLVSNNTVNSMFSDPTASSNQASDAELQTADERKCSVTSLSRRNRNSRPLFHLDSFDESSPIEPEIPLPIVGKPVNNYDESNQTPLSRRYKDMLTQADSNLLFIDCVTPDYNAYNCFQADTNKEESIGERTKVTITDPTQTNPKMNLLTSLASNQDSPGRSYRSLESVDPSGQLYSPKKQSNKFLLQFTPSGKSCSCKSSFPLQDISLKRHVKSSTMCDFCEQNLPNDRRNPKQSIEQCHSPSPKTMETSFDYDYDKGKERSIGTETESLLRKNLRDSVSASSSQNGIFENSDRELKVWPVNPALEEEDEEDEEELKEVRKRERRRRRKRKRRARHNAAYVSVRTEADDVSKCYSLPSVSSDESEEEGGDSAGECLGAIESLLQAV
ncbi:thyrotropin receptor [Plakobranchus ocellatus]|uniref:Thyrotropin receptor n=1 Tax=Plakobranchus ocellatus TaxID=259542 RepID=A0AAV4AU77_9GAST|nr:thyrotropin receptor [Plakobranchus ocellatus]